MSGRGRGLPEAAAGLVAGLLALSGVRCLDVWFHLRTGRIIAETGRIPTVDTLSHTRAGAPWITHEWAFELPLYLLWTVGGDRGLVVVKAVLAAAAGALLVRAGRAVGAGPAAAALAAVAAAVVAHPRFLVRPHVASAVLVAGFVVLAARGGRRAWAAVPLAALWANLHSGVVVGIGVLGAFALEEAARRRRPGPLSAVAAAAALASLANPHGWKVWWYPFWLVWANSQGTFRIMELEPPPFPGVVHGWVAAVAVGGLLAGRRAGIAPWILAVAGAAIGLTRIRGALEAALLGAPLAAVGLVAALGRRLPRRAPGAAALAAGAGAAALALLGWRPTLDVDGWAIPERAMEFVERSGLGGNMFNAHVFGSWLVWAHPERPVYIDGRNEVFVSLFRETIETPVPVLSERYDLGYAVIDYPLDDPRREVEIPVDLGDVLAGDPEWVLVYFDDVARVYARRRPENDEAIARYGYRLLRPGWEDLAYVARYVGYPELAAAFEAEARRAVREAPSSRIARMHLAEFLWRSGRVDEALAELDRADPDDPFVLGRRGAILLAAGRTGEALPALEAALERAPDNAVAWNNLGLARLRLGDVEGALAAFRRAARLDPELLAARDNVALALARLGRTEEAEAARAEAESVRRRQARQAFDRGRRLLEEGFADRAAAELARSVALVPGEANPHYLLGVALHVLGDDASAERELRAALSLDPRHPYARLELGGVLEALGRRDEAAAALRAFLAQGPEARWAAEARRRLAALEAAAPAAAEARP